MCTLKHPLPPISPKGVWQNNQITASSTDLDEQVGLRFYAFTVAQDHALVATGVLLGDVRNGQRLARAVHRTCVLAPAGRADPTAVLLPGSGGG